ncbi:MAG: addiction module antidote protein, HigA family [Thiotrichaceae bacterium IS1]|nr:MAG: addiction module antidote protein, HigA family [Thiotrichaceae bacterium IS1]
MEIGFPVEHPGIVLWEEYLQPLNISATQLATDLHISDSRAQQLLTGQTTLTTDLALRLSRYLGTSAEFWANWQTLYDLQQTAQRRGLEYEKIQKASGLADLAWLPV